MKLTTSLVLFALIAGTLPSSLSAQEKPSTPRTARRPVENREQWYRDGQQAVERAKRLRVQQGKAKNVILFVGDGMGISTVTAARILEGQMRGESGEENVLSFERLPYVALSKTYSANQQTSDSAPTMTAIITGVKTNDGLISVNQDVVRGDHTTVKGNELMTLLEIAEQGGLSTGIVSTARLTHATPASCYAHSADRDWEADADLPIAARTAGFPDIARQLIESPYGDGFEVALGGGRSKFLPRTMVDPEDANTTGERLDKRHLVDEWLAKRPRSAYVWNKREFDMIDPRRTERLLGLFERSHMEYEHDRPKDTAGEPSLTEMTAKAIDMVAKNRKGYFLMVEAGRIDHAHHDGNAYRALTDAVELSKAVRATLAKVDLRETLIIVTADHSHTFTIGGYPERGNDIFGLVRPPDRTGGPTTEYTNDKLGQPYTTLGYANGPGYTGASQTQSEGPKSYPHKADGYTRITKGRPDLTKINTADPNYLQETTVPLGSETHGGEDVTIYAGGPGAHLFHGVQEQNVIFHVMIEALRLPQRKPGR
ncbi:MAG: alkaline phosphatase [Pyrinomonadaceae bacterium]|nr:alkaline phosphatase [Pyrinomonadaceae bacterium]